MKFSQFFPTFTRWKITCNLGYELERAAKYEKNFWIILAITIILKDTSNLKQSKHFLYWPKNRKYMINNFYKLFDIQCLYDACVFENNFFNIKIKCKFREWIIKRNNVIIKWKKIHLCGIQLMKFRKILFMLKHAK